MKVHYKIALLAAVVFLAVVSVYMLTQGRDSTTPTGSDLTDRTAPTPTSTTTTARSNGIAPKPIGSDSKPKDLNALVAEQLAELNNSSAKPVSSTPVTSNFTRPSATTTTSANTSSTSSTTASSNTTTSSTATKPIKPTMLTFGGKPVDNVLTATPPASTTTSTPVVTPPVITNVPAPSTSTLSSNTSRTTSVARTSYPTTYTIQSGDTLSSIALTLYGSDRYWVEIAQANPTIDPLKLKPGKTIKLPLPSDMRKTGSQRAKTASNGKGKQYTVRAGDNLSTIAQEFYNNSGLWRRIYNANKAAIGSNPDTLQAGVTLEIPPVDPGSSN